MISLIRETIREVMQEQEETYPESSIDSPAPYSAAGYRQTPLGYVSTMDPTDYEGEGWGDTYRDPYVEPAPYGMSVPDITLPPDPAVSLSPEEEEAVMSMPEPVVAQPAPAEEPAAPRRRRQRSAEPEVAAAPSQQRPMFKTPEPADAPMTGLYKRPVEEPAAIAKASAPAPAPVKAAPGKGDWEGGKVAAAAPEAGKVAAPESDELRGVLGTAARASRGQARQARRAGRQQARAIRRQGRAQRAGEAPLFEESAYDATFVEDERIFNMLTEAFTRKK